MPSCSPRNTFVCSKSIVQILLWILLFGSLYTMFRMGVSQILKDTDVRRDKIWNSGISYLILALALVFFPVGGLLGDVYWGRYKTVLLSLALIAVSTIIAMVPSVLTVKDDWNDNVNVYRLVAILISISVLLVIPGFSIFSSNIVQFGLDQLMEAPSESLGVFVHWAALATETGVAITNLAHTSSFCLSRQLRGWINHTILILFSLLLITFLIIAYCTRRHFNRDRVKYNPYKMIFRVLNFARKNKYPIGPVSAFTYSYDFRPSRLDYAKERYGGPFTTSDVEDVKAFKNVFLVLLALGPVLILQVPSSNFVFNKTFSHIGDDLSNKSCWHGIEVEAIASSGLTILFLLYIWLNYSVLRNRPVKIMHRLTFSLLLAILSATSMFVIDLAGHLAINSHSNQTQPLCMFIEETRQTLNIHWTVLLFPDITKRLSYALVMATSFEFISAQSPHTMKGVLVGILFALSGVYYAVGGLLFIPFSLKQIWGEGYLGQHPPVVSCGFGYYLVCITVATIGLILFIIAVKRYKYRRRDEEPYSQACVEEIFARRIEDHRKRYGDYEELSGTNDY